MGSCGIKTNVTPVITLTHRHHSWKRMCVFSALYEMCFSLWFGSNVRHHFLTLNVTLDYVSGQYQHQRRVELLQHKGCCYFTCGYFIYRWSFSLVLDCLCWTHAHVTGRVIPSAPGSWLQTFSGLSWSCISNRPSASAGLWLPQQHRFTASHLQYIVCVLLATTFHLNTFILVLLFPCHL